MVEIFFLGVDDNGSIIGVDEDSIENMKKDFANLCNNDQKINPTIYLNIKDFSINDKTILHIYVNESSSVHRTNGKVFDGKTGLKEAFQEVRSYS